MNEVVTTPARAAPSSGAAVAAAHFAMSPNTPLKTATAEVIPDERANDGLGTATAGGAGAGGRPKGQVLSHTLSINSDLADWLDEGTCFVLVVSFVSAVATLNFVGGFFFFFSN